MNFYEKNMEFLQEKDPHLAQKLTEYQEEDEEKVYIEEGKFGYPVVICERKGRSYPLSSPFDGEGSYEENWVSQFSDWEYEGMLFCFGMARLSHIKKFREEFPDYLQLIYEPSVAIFRSILEWVDISFLDEKDVLVVEKLNRENWRAGLQTLTTSDNIPVTRYLCVPNYERVFAKEYAKYTDTIKQISQDTILDAGVWVRFSKELTRNLRDNLKDIMRGADVLALMESFPEGKPGIVVSAGPSLNNNIDELKNAVGKALIVATDTALKPLINHGIRPDAFVTVDPSKPLVLFDHEEVWKIPMIIIDHGNAQVVERHKGKKFFTIMAGGVGRNIYNRFGKKMPYMDTGGSVANNAFSFIRDCGCDPIILVGQDLAYTNKKSHADGTFQDKMEDVTSDGRRYIEIEDIYGNPTLTTADFKHYLEWFEEHIGYLKEKDREVIDATEGGAKIHGATLMTLKDAVAKYCTDEFEIAKYFEEAPDVFNKEERKEVEDYLLDTPKLLDKIKKKAQRGKQDYEDMIFRVRREEWGKELKSSMKRVEKLTNFLDEDDTMKLITPHFSQYDIAYKKRVKRIDTNKTEGLLEMLEMGKEYMEKLLEAVELLRDDFVTMTEKVKEMQEKEELNGEE